VKRFDAVVVSCEHATNWVPAELRPLFAGNRALLDSHRGWDRGALIVAKRVAKELGAPLVAARLSRLVIDHNRSLDDPNVHWGPVRLLEPLELRKLVTRFYDPFRRDVWLALRKAGRSRRRVLHLSMHSFTPVLHGKERIAELGLLYDPSRRLEAELCAAWRQALAANEHGWRVRRNYPYVGWTDGHTTALRKKVPASSYAGVEVEINQSLAAPKDLSRVATLLVETVAPFL
jgi:predicted N-formylglutamate amidohydrolase